MSGFILDDTTCGCPPTEAPPEGYINPFRFNDSGCLWLTSCFKSFTFLGAARHDIGTPFILGTEFTPIASTEDIISGDGITAGTYTNITVTNDTECDLGYLFGYDLNADLDVYGTSYAKIVLSGRWNGVHVSSIACTSVRTGVLYYARCQSGNAASPHDPAIEAGGAASLTLAPGASATVGARLFLQYGEGAPDGTDKINVSGSAVRVYSYVL